MTSFFYKDWPEIWKSEIPPSEFCPISGDWGKLEVPNAARTSLMKCYRMPENASVIAFTVSELLGENQQKDVGEGGEGGGGEGIKLSSPPPRPDYG